MANNHRTRSYFAGGHVADGLVCLDRLQLFQTPLQFFEGLHHHLGWMLLVGRHQRYTRQSRNLRQGVCKVVLPLPSLPFLFPSPPFSLPFPPLSLLLSPSPSFPFEAP